jgi:hypothetical protein
MDDLEGLQVAVGKRRMNQEGFSYSWLSQQYC